MRGLPRYSSPSPRHGRGGRGGEGARQPPRLPPGNARVVALLVALAVAAGLLVVLVRQPPVSPPAAPSVAAPAADAPFRSWLAFEPTRIRSHPDLQDGYVDNILAHQVFAVPPQDLPSYQSQGMLLDDDKLLLPTGRRLWNRELLHQPGLAGKFCYCTRASA